MGQNDDTLFSVLLYHSQFHFRITQSISQTCHCILASLKQIFLQCTHAQYIGAIPCICWSFNAFPFLWGSTVLGSYYTHCGWFVGVKYYICHCVLRSRIWHQYVLHSSWCCQHQTAHMRPNILILVIRQPPCRHSQGAPQLWEVGLDFFRSPDELLLGTYLWDAILAWEISIWDLFSNYRPWIPYIRGQMFVSIVSI